MTSDPAWMKPRWAITVILALTLLAWVPGIVRASFIWDDDQYVSENDNLESFSGLVEAWTEPRSIPQYYPLTHTTFFVERALFGETPWVFRLTNVLLHAGSAILLFFLLRRLAIPGALLAALLFAVHPIQAESVLWITERKNTLSLVFMLASLHALLTWSEQDRRRDLALAFLLFLAALASKSVTCALPAVYLVICWMQGGIRRRDLLATLPFFAIGALAAWFTSHLERDLVGASGREWDLDIAQRCVIAGRALLFYADQLVRPFALSFNYPRWEVTGRGLDLVYPLAALLPLAIALVTLKRVGRGPAAALLLFGGLLLPALGFVDVYPMRYSFVADHFVYHASPALFALGAALVARLSRRVLISTGLIVLAALTWASWERASAYASPEALWRDTIAKNSRSFLARHNLGDLLRARGDIAGALAEHEKARALRPDLGELWTEVAIDLELLGRPDEALAAFIGARDARPEDARLRLNLARALLGRGRADEALLELEAVEGEALDSPVLRGVRGAVLTNSGRIAEALPDLEAATAADSATPTDQLNLSLALERLRGAEVALARLPESTEPALVARRAELLLATGAYARAFELARRALLSGEARDGSRAVFVYLLATRDAQPAEDDLELAQAALGRMGERADGPAAYREEAAISFGARFADLDRARREAQAAETLARRRGDRRRAAYFADLLRLFERGENLRLW